ncbi:Uncharacterised protein [Vibrio cholerae]|nr:Uncharacterised protein [Vibrio cholerae]
MILLLFPKIKTVTSFVRRLPQMPHLMMLFGQTELNFSVC